MCLFYVGQKLQTLPVVSLSSTEVSQVQQLDFRREAPYKAGMAVFRCQSRGPDAPLVLVAVSPTQSRDDACGTFEAMFGRIAAMRFVDDEGDWIEIDSSEAWEYCTRVAIAMAREGNFPLLVLDAQ
jgi:hypothetical protein